MDGHFFLWYNQTIYTIKLNIIYFNFFLSKLLVDYNGMILLREDGLLYQASFDKYISNKTIKTRNAYPTYQVNCEHPSLP